jgi:hypothetical protein
MEAAKAPWLQQTPIPTLRQRPKIRRRIGEELCPWPNAKTDRKPQGRKKKQKPPQVEP